MSSSNKLDLYLYPAVLADTTIFTDVYFTSFQDLISLNCFPRTPSVRKWFDDMNAEAFLKDTSARFIKVLQGKKIVAFAKWIVPIKFGKRGDDPDVMPSWPEDANAELCEEFFGELAKMRRQLMGYRPHYYLEMLGTLPECQGRGAAGQLIRWGLEQADRDGVEAYIEASPVGAPIYERFGWKAEAQVRALNGKYTELLMVRPAIGQGL